jgi:peptidoglycan/xylan/chitin deacetylase (PgdA/CDA1 family)
MRTGKKYLNVFLIFVLFLFLSCSANLKNYSPNGKSAPLITFIFDDGNETDYTVAKDIFKERGEVACSAVVTDWINTENYLTVSQLLELQNDGWEILSHTKSHPNLRKLSENQIETELFQSKSVLEGLGLKVKSLVYPFNKYNEAVIKIAGKYYKAGRGGRIILKSSLPDQYKLKSFSCGHAFSKIKDLIDRAFSEKQWLILYHHRIDARIKLSKKSGVYVSGENLIFTPSGAAGKYIEDNGSKLLFVPISGTPRVNDAVTGQSSGATARVSNLEYNDRETIVQIIEYIHRNYPDMHFVTIDGGVDRIGRNILL